MLAGQCLLEWPLPAEGLQEVSALLRSGDVALTNLETAIAGAHGGTPQRETTLHVAPPSVLDTIAELGVTLLALASNHAYDLGPEGIRSTLEEVSRRGFVAAGMGLDGAGARRAGRLELEGGTEIALLAWNASPNPPGAGARDACAPGGGKPGTNTLEVDLVAGRARIAPEVLASALADVAALRAVGGVRVVYVHQHYWDGDVRVTPLWLRDFAHRCVEEGADVVVCHGPPVLHGVEVYRARAIFYGLASLVFHTERPERYPGVDAWESVIARCRLAGDGALETLELHPVIHGHHPDLGSDGSPGGGPLLARDASGDGVLARMAERCAARHGTTFRLSEGRLILEGSA